jgi:hypothetical protein
MQRSTGSFPTVEALKSEIAPESEGDLAVVKGVITNYGSNGEVRFGKVFLMMRKGDGNG